MMLIAAAVGPADAATADADVAAKPSAGCDDGAKAKQGESRLQITSGGEDRSYFRFIPRAYDGEKPLAVVFDLHGHTESAAFHKSNSGLAKFGNTKGFITITPEGSGPPPKWETTEGAADLQFLVDLLDELETDLCIDTRRVFVTGYSNGAFVTSLFACEHADRFAAFAPVAGIRNPPTCTPSRPPPIVAFHGIADEWISYSGGYGPGVYRLPPAETAELVRSGEATYSDLSIPDVVATWAARNGCDPAPTTTKVSEDTTRFRYACPDGADVELFASEGAGHTWPGSKASAALERYIGPTTLQISANALLWKFFQQHPLRDG